MNKKEIKEILISMRTAENEKKINNLLGKIDLLTDEKIETLVSQIGDNEESIKEYLSKRLEERKEVGEEHIPINEMFTYGVTENVIHLHMPIDLNKMLSEMGYSKTISTVNLQLLDAIERIRKMQKDGYYKFEGKSSIYMISPILRGKEIDFLKDLDFDTKVLKKDKLQDEEFVEQNDEAKLATKIFGKDKDIGTATIGLDVVNSEEWQAKREAKVKEFEEKGIKLDTGKGEKDE